MNELTVFQNQEFGRMRTTEIAGKVWFVGKDVARALGYWAVFGRSKSAVNGAVSTPEYTVEYNLTVNGHQAYVLTLDDGAFESLTLTISGPGTIPATIQTGVADQWYDLASVTAENAALQEAELILRAVEQKQVAPRMPGGTSKIQSMVRIARAPVYDNTNVSINVTLDGATKYKCLILCVGRVATGSPAISVRGGSYSLIEHLYFDGYGGGDHYTSNGLWVYLIKDLKFPVTVNASYSPGYGERNITLYGIL